MEKQQALLELKNIHKQFGGIYALKQADLSIYPGEVVALIGENGAGKSTCVKIMTGLYQPDDGDILYKGQKTSFTNAQAASQQGIAAIHQETVLFDELNIAENIFMGQQIKNKYGFLDWPLMHQKAAMLLKKVNLKCDTHILLKDLSLARQHMVAIARALAQKADIVIMDEPTASLSFKEIEELYLIIEKLKAEGKGILFISHKFDEIFRIADRFVVYRDGSYVADGDIKDVTENQLVAHMVGREVKNTYPKPDIALGENCIEVKGLSNNVEFADISFALRKREILGLNLFIWLAIGVVLMAYILAQYTKYGREIFGYGGNPLAAEYIGVPIKRRVLSVYMFSGTLAGLCGWLWTSRYATANTDIAFGFELQTVAACVIGGVAISGGKGGVLGCMLGAIFLGSLYNVLPIIGVNQFWQQALSGLIILTAVWINQLKEKPAVHRILETKGA